MSPAKDAKFHFSPTTVSDWCPLSIHGSPTLALLPLAFAFYEPWSPFISRSVCPQWCALCDSITTVEPRVIFASQHRGCCQRAAHAASVLFCQAKNKLKKEIDAQARMPDCGKASVWTEKASIHEEKECQGHEERNRKRHAKEEDSSSRRRRPASQGALLFLISAACPVVSGPPFISPRLPISIVPTLRSGRCEFRIFGGLKPGSDTPSHFSGFRPKLALPLCFDAAHVSIPYVNFCFVLADSLVQSSIIAPYLFSFSGPPHVLCLLLVGTAEARGVQTHPRGPAKCPDVFALFSLPTLLPYLLPRALGDSPSPDVYAGTSSTRVVFVRRAAQPAAVACVRPST
ncbi:hypothetical protein HPB51_017608 [Rhipicephalus microplus]|uniref:Uncharacterized protein n=1 Tax=Rhipicephalus microplus TaxID=6941 RepID=A0A9J6EHP1_RHIMP|nr:hypothetical protein HPB51_017608 [Rhipicephalus microplus]